MPVLKTIAAAALATGLLGTVGAQAQTATLVEVSDATMIAMINADADTLEDMNVHNAAGQKIGEIEEVLGPDASNATAIAIDFDNNAEYGREDRIVPLDSFTLQGVKLTLNSDAAAVGTLPVYND